MASSQANGAVAAKSIILFSDGTGNSSAKLFKTNVWRLYEAVDLGPAEEGRQRQIASYDSGVGSSGFRILQMVQGVFGWGLRRNLLELYCYACRNYDPATEPSPDSGITRKGDHIYGFGFSRGAFTMRLVIGMIAEHGLVPYTNEDELGWKAQEVYRDFRRGCSRRSVRWFRKVTGMEPPAAAPRARTRKGVLYDPAENHRPVIRFMGVWDTVAAYGGPIAELTRAIDTWVYPLSMPNYELSENVLCARHALALDDERDSFWPLLWDEVAWNALADRCHPPGSADNRRFRERLKQVWFTGMHADVGGGYPDESLSYVSLLWMMEEAEACGLRTLDAITARYQALVNSFGPLHDSRQGLAGYYRYQPRKLAAWLHPVTDATLSYRDPTIRLDGRQKGLLEKIVVHQSVINRIASGTDGYAPIVLPGDFDIIPPEGRLDETAPQVTTGGEHQPSPHRAQADDAAVATLEAPAGRARLAPKAAVAAAMEGVWDLVWARRAAYFATVVFTIVLLAWPWIAGSDGQRLSAIPVGATWLQLLAATVGDLIGDLVRWLGGFLPAFTARWVEAWAGAPLSFLLNLLAIGLSRMASARLARRISDRARAIWHGVLPRIPPATAGQAPRGALPHGGSWFQALRTSRGYQRSLQLVKWGLLPNVFGVLILLAFIWLGAALVTQAAIPVLEADLAFCRDRPAPRARAAAAEGVSKTPQQPVVFAPADPCNETNLPVSERTEYAITFEVGDAWLDGSYPASPEGFGAGRMRWLSGYLGSPFRRVMNLGYMQPVAVIRVPRKTGAPSVRLVPLDLAPVPGEPQTFAGSFIAPASGELTLFANDVVALYDLDGFYANNRGTAIVSLAAKNAGAGAPASEKRFEAK